MLEAMITTSRLILRPWRETDREPYVAMMADPEVGYWLGGTRAREVALADIERWDAVIARDGFGFFALERKADGAFLGAAALLVLPADRPPGPCHELGWRLAREAWGFGYATEAARALLDEGFERLNLSEILAFTATSNLRSRAVMERLGMRRDESRDFDHPALAPDHPLRRHVVYVASAR
jgi:RimJ/RimL family protein N-acetyltransferase